MNSIVSRYETAFAKWFGVTRAFSFWKGRVALYATLKALGVAPGDEIILPGYTCVVDANPIKYLGARPVYVDIKPDTFNVDVNLLEENITPRTKAIIAQHTYGYPCDMDAIMSVAQSTGVAVIEDCCLAFGSKYKNQTVGTFGKASYFSSQWNKSYTTGLGGMVLANDSEFAESIELLCAKQLCCPSTKEVAMLALQLMVYRALVYPRTTVAAQNAFRYLTKKGLVLGSYSMAELKPVMEPDFFKSMSSIQARSGLRQFKKIEQNIAHRKKMAEIYDELLEEKGWKGRNFDRALMDPVMVRYPVRITDKEKALADAAKAGIELGSWFESPLHPSGTALDVYDYKLGMCPEAEKAAREVVNLPLHPRVGEKTAEKQLNS